ncbi:hypothetical protein JW992_06700 [candidate division KSB1 bacterium]|nr:hypothetical protein [candidate division KSB1 bacterium]
MTNKTENAGNAGVTTSRIKFCDLRCEHASFPQEEHLDGANSCRTFAALYCAQLNELVTKNAPCAVLFGKRRPKSNL